MMQQIYILTIFLISLTSAALAQNNFTAQPLPKTVNSEYNDFNPVISPDGKIIYFTRASHPENSHNPRKAFGPADSEDIWFSNYQKDGTWSTAERLPAPFNTGVYNGLHSISEDGEIFLINGVYDKKNRWIKRGLSVCTKADNGWTNPVELKVVGKLKKNKGIASNAFMTTDEQLLFLSYANNYGGKKQNLYVSINNGDYFSKPIKLPKTVNTRKFKEEAPFYDSALQRLYFSSNRENAAKGKDGMNIYYTQPSDKTFTSWSAPTRFSGTEGSATWESYYKLNHKGSWAYFASDKNSPGAADIYRIKIFEENPFVEVSGQVRDIATNLALPSKYKFKILANNTEVDSIKINPDDATFVMKLPLGKKYILQADSKNHVAILDTVDATGHKEFFEV